MVKKIVSHLRSSVFARHALAMLFFNAFSKGLGILGSGYAARCLGPEFLGVSGLVQTLVQQGFLSVHGGFENIVVREISHDPKRVGMVTQTMVTTRLIGVSVISVIWAITSFHVYPEIPMGVKLLGIPLLFLSALSFGAAFQGLEKLPIQTAIGTLTSLLTVAAYFLFFRPGMRVGSDLVVFLGAGMVGVAVSVWYFHRLTGVLPWGRINRGELIFLISKSWRYWLVGVVCFIYTTLQIPITVWFLGWKEGGVVRSALMISMELDLLYSSINNLMIPRFIAWKREGLEVLRARQARIVPLFLALGGGLTVVFWLTVPWLYHVVLGDRFEEGIAVVRILSLARLIVFVGQIYAYGLIALSRDQENFQASLIGAGVSLAMTLLLIKPYGILAVAGVAVVTEAVVVGLCVFYSFRYYNKVILR